MTTGTYLNDISALCQKYRVVAEAHLPLEAQGELEEIHRRELARRAQSLELVSRVNHPDRLAKAKAARSANNDRRRAELYRAMQNTGGIDYAPIRYLSRELGISTTTIMRWKKEFLAERDAKRVRCGECGQLRPTRAEDEP